MKACHDCDALQHEVLLEPGGVARCWRCDALLYRGRDHAIDRTLALTLAATALFLLALSFPLVELDMQGKHHSTTLWGAVTTLWRQDVALVATLVAVTTVLMPTLELGAMLWLLLPLALRQRPPGGTWVLRALLLVRPWGMVEVFVLGVLVALVKLTHIASVIPGIALWSFGGLICVFAAAAANFDAEQTWERLGETGAPA
ncbi:paraquat-inducible protein A [Methylibium sp.]|uniref:paraquat-inducible protein A n=1 Tax=Methylibium sp. TaxID=2067992 RepID=UPI003D096F94